jgi:hypothetical protein
VAPGSTAPRFSLGPAVASADPSESAAASAVELGGSGATGSLAARSSPCESEAGPESLLELEFESESELESSFELLLELALEPSFELLLELESELEFESESSFELLLELVFALALVFELLLLFSFELALEFELLLASRLTFVFVSAFALTPVSTVASPRSS